MVYDKKEGSGKAFGRVDIKYDTITYKCNNCGAKVSINDSYCGQCGKCIDWLEQNIKEEDSGQE